MSTDRQHLFIDGEYVAGSGGLVDVVNPSTGKRLGAAATAAVADIDAAVAAANAARAGWAATAPGERADLLDRFAAALEARGADTARLVTQENGMPITLSKAVNGQ